MASPDVQRIRSRSVPARLAVLAGAIALGLALQGVVGARLAEIQELAERDVVAARQQLGAILRVVAIGLFGGLTALGGWMAWASWRSLADGVFPPRGAWGFGSAGRLEGAAARRAAGAMLGLAIALAVLSLVGGGLTWYMAATLIACRAGV
jgi:hypothetical protein